MDFNHTAWNFYASYFKNWVGSPQRRLTSVLDLENPGGSFGFRLKVSRYMPGLLPPKLSVPVSTSYRSKTILAVTNAAVKPIGILAIKFN
jgi:hypothetical protein